MHDSPLLIARLNLLSSDAIRRLNTELLTPVIREPAAVSAPHREARLRYEFHRPWYTRFAAKGCNRCGGEPPGWLQRQLQTPNRFKRLILWVVNLVPRGTSFVRVVFSRRVSSAVYEERTASCATCPSAIIQLRVRGGKVRETSYCGMCDCPKWYASRNAVRNRRAAWRCPAKRHNDSDPNAVFADYVRGKAETGDSSNGR